LVPRTRSVSRAAFKVVSMIFARTSKIPDAAPAHAAFAAGIGASGIGACAREPFDAACPNSLQAGYRPEIGSEVPR
jgi:hypothetical protein